MLSSPPTRRGDPEYYQALGSLAPWVEDASRNRGGNSPVLLAVLRHIWETDRGWLLTNGLQGGIAGLYVGFSTRAGWSTDRLWVTVILYGNGYPSHSLDPYFAEYMDFPRKASWEAEENDMTVIWRASRTEYSVEAMMPRRNADGSLTPFMRAAIPVNEFHLVIRLDDYELRRQPYIEMELQVDSEFCNRLHDAIARGSSGDGYLMGCLLAYIRRDRIEVHVADACRRRALTIQLERSIVHGTLDIVLIGETTLPLPAQARLIPVGESAIDHTPSSTLLPVGGAPQPEVVQSEPQQETKNPIVPPSAERRLLLSSRQRGDKDEPYSVNQGSDDPVYRRPSRRNRGVEPKR